MVVRLRAEYKMLLPLSIPAVERVDFRPAELPEKD